VVGPGYISNFQYQVRVDSNAPVGVQSDLVTITYTGQTAPATISAPVTILPNSDVFYASRNVFKPSTDGPVSIHVEYSKFPGNYQLWVYNSAGEHVRTLDSDYLTAPVNRSYEWDGKNKNGEECSSGVYILYLLEPFDRKYKRILLVR
jgi:flagellar hook assembly protein FlgD